ncbi:MAG: UDP-N-acetylmuramoyl-L-alanyl-D-glutamate--2,6-diaminopimelate ligase [Ignavibacteria bacterium GWF2_33_9]|nr:MAG: UDP-N-acetylmuramoyl-L-alanyl-D-glutamate--2,6-diaminopimelate ligase [Ignavibacteria bacterium GWF2_33_9]
MKNLQAFLKIIKIIEIIGKSDVNFQSISYNSSKIEEKSIFVALKGLHFDGHNFINEAIAKGAQIIVCEEFPQNINENITYVKVENTRKALAEISNFFFDYPVQKMKFIGVTGTNGKTTTAFLIQSLLKQANKKVAVIGTTGIFYGERKIPATHTTPESLELFKLFREMADDGVEWVVMEVSSHSLVQNRVWGIPFFVAIFTNLTHDHLDFHGNLENYAAAKKIIFDNLSQDSIAVVNADDEFQKFILQDCPASQKFYITRKEENSNENRENIFQIKNEKISFSGIKFSLDIVRNNNIEKFVYDAKLIGKFNIDNLTYSLAAMFGMHLSIKFENMDFLQGAAGRMDTVFLPNGAVGLVDYAHTPDALEKALETLEEIKENLPESENSPRIISVFGCGGDRDKEKRPKMGNIAAEKSDLAIITSDNPRTENPAKIIKDILSGIPLNNLPKVQIIINRKDAISYAYSKSKQGDIILVAGKGHEDYQIIGTEKLHFDDKEELQKLID